VVIGDSLTESAKEELDATLRGRGIASVTIDGLANRRMVRFADGVAPGVDAIADAVAASTPAPDVWVLALGTNDVGGAASPAEFEADMRALLALVPADAPVVWVDVWIRDLAEESAAANAVIRDVLAPREAATVIDWYSRGDDPGVVLDDGVHLTDDGQWIFATAITDAVAAAG
jgi:lysophospholipase L1-like esterase